MHRDRYVSRTASAGFTLLETLIAMVVLTLMLTTLLQAYVSGARGIAASEDHLRARLLAQSVLAENTRDRSAPPANLQGSFDRYAWSFLATPVVEDDRPAAERSPWIMYHLTVTVSWASARRVSLETMRLGRRP